MIRNANERKTALGKIEGNGGDLRIWLKPFGTTNPIEFKSWAEVKAYEAKIDPELRFDIWLINGHLCNE